MKAFFELLLESRQKKGWSQREASRICGIPPATYNKIENGKVPSVDQMYLLGDAYGFVLEEIRPYMTQKKLDKNQVDHQQDLKHQTREAVQFDQYHKLGELILFMEKSKLFKEEEDKQFVLWHQSIHAYEFLKDPELGAYHLTSALESPASKRNRERFIELLNSKAAFYMGQNSYEQAKEVLEHAQQMSHSLSKIHIKVRRRLLYNLSITFFHLENLQQSYRYAWEALATTQTNDSTYLLGEIYFQYGYTQFFLKNIEEAKRYIEYSIQHFSITQQQGHLAYTMKVQKDFRLGK